MNVIKPTWLGNKYILLDLLGTGGMAEVYRGKLVGEKGFEKLIVIKRLLAHVSADPHLVEHFTAEARLAALLQHENIAAVYDFGRIGEIFFIAMEYLFGKDLYSLMQEMHRRQIPFPPEYALMIIAKIAEAMAYAHSLSDLHENPLNIIHRDLTPHNIFVTYDGKVKVIDFGIAKTELHDNLTQVGVVKGKICYMSPEQLSGERIDHRSDIFSIGILLYEMLSGRRLYTGDTASLIRKAIKVEYVYLEKVRSGLIPEIYVMLHKALALDPEKRYRNCDDMLADIEVCLSAMSFHYDSRLLKGFMGKLFSADYQRGKKACANGIEAASNLEAEDLREVEKTKQYTPDVRTDRIGTVRRGLLFSGRCMILIKGWWKFFGVAALLGIILILFVISRSGSDSNNIETTTITTEEGYGGVSTASKIPLSASQQRNSGEQRRIVEELIQKAEQSLAAGHLISPEGANAVYYYRQIHTVDPSNNSVLDGVRRIADIFAQQAETALTKKDFQRSAGLIRDGLDVYPDSERLKQIRERMKNESRQRIFELQQLAEESLKDDRLTTPKDDCAYKYFRQIENLDENSNTALEGFEKIGDRYAVLANAAFRQFEIDAARHYVAEGLQVVPDHWRLKVLHRDLQRSNPGLLFKSLEKNIKTLVQ